MYCNNKLYNGLIVVVTSKLDSLHVHVHVDAFKVGFRFAGTYCTCTVRLYNMCTRTQKGTCNLVA